MKKKYTFITITALIILLTAFLIFILRKETPKTMTDDEFYAVVNESYAGYALIKPLDESVPYEVISVSISGLKVGDIIKLKVKDIKEIYPPEAEVESYEILQTNKISELDKEEKTTNIPETTTKIITESVIKNNNNKKTETTTTTRTTTTTATSKKNADDEVIAFFNTEINTADNKSKSSLKNSFIKVVDFIFYDKDINGYYFKDLTSSAKLKVISLALKLDSIIDKHFPGYKEELSSSYKKAKDSLITLYLNLTTEFCKNNDSVCQSAKDDFGLLKESLNLTWDVISTLAKSGGAKIKEWYEIFSGK